MEQLVDKEHARKVALGDTEAYIYKHGYVSEVAHGIKENNEWLRKWATFLRLKSKKTVFSTCTSAYR